MAHYPCPPDPGPKMPTILCPHGERWCRWCDGREDWPSPLTWHLSLAISATDMGERRCGCPRHTPVRQGIVYHRRARVATHARCTGCGAEWVWGQP